MLKVKIIKFRKASLRDLNEIYEIYREGQIDEESISSKKNKKEILSELDKSKKNTVKGFRKSISSNKEIILVCEKDGIIVGFGDAVKSSQKRSAEISLVYVKREHRKKGVASKIVKELLKWIKKNNEKKVIATMDIKNKASMNLHKKFGFKEVIVIMSKEMK